MLRDYQQKAVDMTWDYMRNNEGNPCIEMPTGSGKSWVIAAICKEALSHRGTRILMLTHVRELVAQNFDKLSTLWPEAPVGIYAAGLNRRETGYPITYGSVQTVQRNIRKIGKQDLIIVDECHRISHKDDETGYRQIIKELDPYRVIGVTASPVRLGHGAIVGKGAMFDDIIKPTSISELVERGYLAPLKNKSTSHKISVKGVHKRGGEFIESELQAAVNTDDNNEAAINETLTRVGGRKALLFFCSGVAHSFAIRDLLRSNGIAAETITGETPTCERDDIIARFKSGEIRAVTNANVLTTGFDYPDIDCLVFLRPTMSPSLYVQMAGRGMRPKSHCSDCLVLDFAEVVRTHGPITNVQAKPPSEGEAPMKTCPSCDELVFLSTRVCPECGYEWPVKPPEPKAYKLDELVDIMGRPAPLPESRRQYSDIELEENQRQVYGWSIRTHVTKAGDPCLLIEYRTNAGNFTEYLNINHPNPKARDIARKKTLKFCHNSGVDLSGVTYTNPKNIKESTKELAAWLRSKLTPPSIIEVGVNNGYENVTRRMWL